MVPSSSLVPSLANAPGLRTGPPLACQRTDQSDPLQTGDPWLSWHSGPGSQRDTGVVGQHQCVQRTNLTEVLWDNLEMVSLEIMVVVLPMFLKVMDIISSHQVLCLDDRVQVDME